ncbi:WecB/TagA/CpsF family glycosyltransferase [Sphingomonas daechungensis]|uniref:WecB/TagA/CpsF family glycosyltransferase n=2 Tax=Sphingomonas daechungensis TaxID=1176646 RepID=UPI0031ECCE6E
MPTSRRNFLDVDFDAEPTNQILARIEAVGADSPYQFLVTPNVDHLVRLHRRASDVPGLENAYRQANFCVCDSKVLARLAKWKGVDLPVLPGSDLTEILLKSVVVAGDKIAIVGGDPETADDLQSRFPQLKIVQHRPPMGLLTNASARTAAAQFVARERARFTFICVGSPQQELIAAEVASMPKARGLALCVGAGLDFVTNKQKRAPLIARKLGLEWAHRLATNPRRLWRRYLVEGPAIFLMAYRWQKTAA